MADQKKVTDLAEIRRQVQEANAKAAEEFGSGGGGDGQGVDGRFVMECLDANELGDGMLFAEIHRGRYLFHAAAGRWMVWAGHHWAWDELDTHLGAVEAVVKRYLAEFKRVDDEIRVLVKDGKKESADRLEPLRQKLKKRILKLRGDRGRNACIKFAWTCPEGALAIKGDELDRDPWLLACPNGVVDLRTGELEDGRPEQMLSKACNVPWPEGGIATSRDLWIQTMTEIMDGDQAMVDYLQRLFGYAITGLTTEHVLPVCWGQGRNGKSMLVETIKDVLGPLAASIESEMLLAQFRPRGSGGPTSDIMALHGRRLAIGSETDEGRRISPSKVKWLTGGDALVGRNPHDRFQIEFKPQHLLILLTNHKPNAPSDDFAFWERVHLIPFVLSFVDREPQSPNERRADKGLPARLRDELPGILAWLVEGCLQWQRVGLAPPAKVLDATADYRADEDIITDFLEECCVKDVHEKVGATVLYLAFESWHERAIGGRYVPKQKKFGGMMSRKGMEKEKIGGNFYYLGWRLKEEHERG